LLGVAALDAIFVAGQAGHQPCVGTYRLLLGSAQFTPKTTLAPPDSVLWWICRPTKRFFALGVKLSIAGNKKRLGPLSKCTVCSVPATAIEATVFHVIECPK